MIRRAERWRAPERLAETLPAVPAQVRDCGSPLGTRAVFRCDWCETEHLHRPGSGARCAHCTIPDSAYAWTGYTLLMDGREGEHPSPPRPAVHQSQRRLRTTAAALARRLRRTVLDALLGQPLRGSRGSVSINGHQVWISDADLWCVAPEALGEGTSVETRGHGLSGLAAALYGVSRGVAAARLLQAVTGDTYDPKALAEISAAVDGWAARGTFGRGTPA